MFIVQGAPDLPLYLWKGNNLLPANAEHYQPAALAHIKLLQTHERANSQVLEIQQGQEDDKFWQLFFLNEERPPTEQLYGNMAEWDRLIIDLSAASKEKKAPMIMQMQEDKNFIEEEQRMKPRLYTYPNWNESCTVFEYEDLLEESFFVLCVRADFSEPGHEHDTHKVFTWRGNDFDDEEDKDIIET